MAEGGTVVVDVEPRLDKNKAKRGFSTFAKAAAGVFAGVFAAKFAVDFGKDLIKQAEEYNSLVSGVGNLVANQQKALGDEATLTTEAIVDQAKALQALTGFSDENILSGQRQLLSFQNIQNAGEGVNAIYDRATGALTDLIASGALTDFNSGAIQIGKALNDPIKGVTALGRAGIQFTDSQKEAIAAMVEGNDVLGAQKLILDELEAVYGGTAESQRDATAVIANAWQDLKVKAGNVLLPIVERVATWIVDRAIPAFEAWWPSIKAAGEALGKFFAAGWERVQPVLETVWGILQDLGAWITGTLIPIIRDKWWPVAVEVWGVIESAASEAWDVIQPILEGMEGLFGDVATFIDDTIVPALGNWEETNNETVNGLVRDFQLGWSVIKPVLLDWADTVVTSFQRGEDGMSDFERGARFLFESIEPALIQLTVIWNKAFEAIRVAVETAITVITFIWDTWGDEITQVAINTWNAITEIVAGAFRILEGFLDVFHRRLHRRLGASLGGPQEHRRRDLGPDPGHRRPRHRQPEGMVHRPARPDPRVDRRPRRAPRRSSRRPHRRFRPGHPGQRRRDPASHPDVRHRQDPRLDQGPARHQQPEQGHNGVRPQRLRGHGDGHQ